MNINVLTNELILAIIPAKLMPGLNDVSIKKFILPKFTSYCYICILHMYIYYKLHMCKFSGVTHLGMKNIYFSN